jgi:hypothetical protein
MFVAIFRDFGGVGVTGCGIRGDGTERELGGQRAERRLKGMECPWREETGTGEIAGEQS